MVWGQPSYLHGSDQLLPICYKLTFRLNLCWISYLHIEVIFKIMLGYIINIYLNFKGLNRLGCYNLEVKSRRHSTWERMHNQRSWSVNRPF